MTIDELITETLKEFDERYDHYNPIHDDGKIIPVWRGKDDYNDLKGFLRQAMREAYEKGYDRGSKLGFKRGLDHAYQGDIKS